MKKINEKEIIDVEYEPVDDTEEIFEDPLVTDEKALFVENKNSTFEKLSINEKNLFAKTGNTEIDFSKYDAQEHHKKNATKSKSPTKKQRRSHTKQVKQSRRRNRH